MYTSSTMSSTKRPSSKRYSTKTVSSCSSPSGAADIDAIPTLKERVPLVKYDLEPLIPEAKRYRYSAKKLTQHLNNVIALCQSKGLKIDPPQGYITAKLVYALCVASEKGIWTDVCENALVEALPLREHHKSFISHNMFVTTIGTLVARALERATKGSLDLLADRYYVRGLACHDSSKTSATEASAYAGIMAVHMEDCLIRSNLATDRVRFKSTYKHTPSQNHLCDVDTAAAKSMMANFGFKHHYKTNPHHPEHFPDGRMYDMNVVEAIVDGLACAFELQLYTTHIDWLGSYRVERFKDASNKELAKGIILSLKQVITESDFKALLDFRTLVFSLVGESLPWEYVKMTECCIYAPSSDVPVQNMSQHFSLMAYE